MRVLLISSVCILTLILILLGINPQPIFQIEGTNDNLEIVLFKKATGNISKLRAIIENCAKVSLEDTETVENEGETISIEQKILKELELIVAYQNKVIAKYKYDETQKKSIKREVSLADVQKAYRELESAELYLSRLLETYPQGTELLK